MDSESVVLSEETEQGAYRLAALLGCEWLRVKILALVRAAVAVATREKDARIAELEGQIVTNALAHVAELRERDTRIAELTADLVITAQYASLGYPSVARRRCEAWLSAHGPEPTGVGSDPEQYGSGVACSICRHVDCDGRHECE